MGPVARGSGRELKRARPSAPSATTASNCKLQRRALLSNRASCAGAASRTDASDDGVKLEQASRPAPARSGRELLPARRLGEMTDRSGSWLEAENSAARASALQARIGADCFAEAASNSTKRLRQQQQRTPGTGRRTGQQGAQRSAGPNNSCWRWSRGGTASRRSLEQGAAASPGPRRKAPWGPAATPTTHPLERENKVGWSGDRPDRQAAGETLQKSAAPAPCGCCWSRAGWPARTVAQLGESGGAVRAGP